MTTKQYRRMLELLELSQNAAGRVLGIDSRTSRRYALDENERGIPESVNVVLRLMRKFKLTEENIEKLKREKIE